MSLTLRVLTLVTFAVALLAAGTAAQVVADFSADVTSGDNPLTVSFTDLSTGGPNTWLWGFGDGGSSSEQHPTHVFTLGGPYTVTLTALAEFLDIDFISKPDLITVDAVPITVDFTASLTQGVSELTVQFTDFTNPVPTAWLWDFGDGNTSTQQHPTHTFLASAAPPFDVSLSVAYYGQAAAGTQPGLIQMAPNPLGDPLEIEGYSSRDGWPVDLDGDGDLDVLRVGSNLAMNLTWYRNVGGANPFALAQSLGTGFSSWLAAVGDVDGDGDADAMLNGAQGVLVANTDGAGTLAVQAVVVLLGDGDLVDLADFDGDGDLDLVAGEYLSNLAIYQNVDGAGGFGAGQLIGTVAFTSLSDLTAHDVDGDGDQDVAWVNWSGGGVGWLENAAGDGTSWTQHDFGASKGRSLAFADLDGDGDDDLVAAGTEHPLAWFEHVDSAGFYGPAQPIDGPWNVRHVTSADLDGDGDRDLVHGGDYTPLAWLENVDGAGDFGVTHALSSGMVRRVRVGDLDGDGDDDLLTADGSSGLEWFRNQHSRSWTVAGPGLAGSDGVPYLHAHGTLGGGDLVTLALENAPPSGLTTLVLGLSALSLPFKGGTLVPFPDATATLPIESNGVAVLHATWPVGIPAGLPFYAQHWMADAGAVHGFAASNALVGTADP